MHDFNSPCTQECPIFYSACPILQRYAKSSSADRQYYSECCSGCGLLSLCSPAWWIINYGHELHYSATGFSVNYWSRRSFDFWRLVYLVMRKSTCRTNHLLNLLIFFWKTPASKIGDSCAGRVLASLSLNSWVSDDFSNWYYGGFALILLFNFYPSY